MATQDSPNSSAEKAPDSLAERILDAAVRLAEESSWESVRLHHVATEMDLDLEVIHRFYRQKSDDLVEAWYDRADRAMLADAALPDYLSLSSRKRLHRSIMCWLTSMQNHRRVSRDMLMYKLELGHVHLQVLGLLRISRTVQWIMESAQRDGVHLRRVAEEIALTSIYLGTFAHWLFDESSEAKSTRRLLNQLLRRAETMARFFRPFGAREGELHVHEHGAQKPGGGEGIERSVH
jgi:AcrR family transcriptional regulator